MIRFTAEGIFADTEEERKVFYDKLTAGDPVIWGHIQVYNMELDAIEREDEN